MKTTAKDRIASTTKMRATITTILQMIPRPNSIICPKLRFSPPKYSPVRIPAITNRRNPMNNPPNLFSTPILYHNPLGE